MVGAMFGMFFYLTQFLQGAEGYSALKAGLAFLPVTLTIFSMVKVVPKLLGRVGPFRVLIGGLALALIGLALAQPDHGRDRLLDRDRAADAAGRRWHGPRLHAADPGGDAGVDNHDAGAASGLVNVFQQLGSTIGIGVLVTVFAAASEGTGAKALIEGVPSTIAVSAGLIALALAVALTLMRPLAAASPAVPQGAVTAGE